MTLRRLWLVLSVGIVLAVLALWLTRADLAAQLAQSYFRQHGIASQIRFGRLGLSGLSGRIVLGPPGAPDFSADAVEVDFDPLSFVPRIVHIRLINPVVRAELTPDGKLRLRALQAWLDSLSGGPSHSRYVSDDLAISCSNLRAFLATPGGALELDGDAALRHGELLSAAITARAGTLLYQGTRIQIVAADLRLNPAKGAFDAVAHFQGAVQGPQFSATGMTASFTAPGLHWDAGAKSFTARSLHVQAAATALRVAGYAAAHPQLDLAADAPQGALAQAGSEGAAVFQLKAGADFAPGALAKQFPALARDPVMTRALQDNLRHLDLNLAANIARQNGAWNIALKQPARLAGAKGAALEIATFALAGPPASLRGNFNASFGGAGLAALTIAARDFRLQNGVFTSDAALQARFSFAMLRGADFAANGHLSFRDGSFGFTLSRCGPLSLAAFHPGDSDLGKTIKASLCPVPGKPAFTTDATGWQAAASLRDAALALPLGTVLLDQLAGSALFTGKGDAVTGKIAVTAARLSDGMKPERFAPLSGTGAIALEKWVWHGSFAAGDPKGSALGTASFNYGMASGVGAMAISAPHLQFAPGQLQPAALSPLLGAVSRAQGAARFDGAVTWTPAGLQSHGTLVIDKLDFLTPLGTAHAVNATIALTSLLPPATAPGQHITISRIDWTLPLSGLAMDIGFGGGQLRIDNFSTTISEGGVKLGGLAIDLGGGKLVEGAASLAGISLAPLIAASNLGSKIKLEGKVTGTVPFSYGPAGFRIVNGHLASDGPGRIELNRSVWNEQGGVAVNAVQDLAYQALENLAYDQLTADINSVAGGRLQVVFHVKGRSDPPKPQQAEIAIADILNGSALQKPIALPSATPIDLTLDTSLNFDELLKSYGEAWSKTLGRP